MASVEDDTFIPVIDISSNNPDAPHQLLNAASTYGFVYVENNEAGVPPGDIEQIFRMSETFFSSPVKEKESVSIKSNSVGKNHGWLSQGVEKLDPRKQKRADVKEAMNIGEPVNGAFQQPLPASLPPQTIMAFQKACHGLCQRLNEAFAIALGIEKDWFTSRHADFNTSSSSSVFRLLYYPHTPEFEDGVDIRAGAHSDYGSITLLFQQDGQPGLEIRTPNGEWASVPVNPRASAGSNDSSKSLPILVNIGDLLEDWTCGLLKSTVHRVVFPLVGPRADRYSVAYFCHPNDHVKLEPVPSRLVEEHAARTGHKGLQHRKEMTSADHLREKLAATYSVT